MAAVTHRCDGRQVSGRSENPHFLITDARGSRFSLGNPDGSNYDGYFVRDAQSVFKVLADISPLRPTDTLIVDDYVVREAGAMTQSFTMFPEGIRSSCEGIFRITLDCKRLYDESDQGRVYEVAAPYTASPAANLHGGYPITVVDVKYVKYADSTLREKRYELHLTVATTMDCEFVKQWREAQYAYDARRSTRCTPWVYDLLTINGSGDVAVAYGTSPEDARLKALIALTAHVPQVDAPAMPLNARLAWRALHALRTTHYESDSQEGIMAGLPWFFKHWSRDELIACGGLIAAREYTPALRILEKWYGAIRADGTLPAIYPDEGLESSDAPGWLGKRTRDLLVRLSDEGSLHRIPRETLIRWREKTALLLGHMVSCSDGGLVRSGYNTTWMDTSSNDDGRAGYRIEIQALFLSLYDCHAYLCAITKTPVDARLGKAATDAVNAVHGRLVDGGVLLDGLHADGTPDRTVRPNIFLAWYVAPKLFSAEEWKRFFAAALPKLFLPWGGLSSIAQDDPNFHASYTGEDVASYHRGDSWYFVNNIAAIAMHAVDPAGFKDSVERISAASVADMLWQGYCGHCSELSSAGKQEAAGTHAQAWSASTLLELLLILDR